MKTFGIVFATAAALLSIVRADEEAVLTLTDDTFDGIVAENEYVLAEFYAPWCGHCKSLAPEYEKAAQKMVGFEPKVILAKIDATEEKKLAEKFEVQGFPTLKWIVGGKAMEYTGGRTEDTIVSWLKKKTGPACTSLTSQAEVDTFKASSDAVVIGAFATEEDSKAGFEAAAKGIDDVPFGTIIGDADLAKAAGIENGAGVAAFRTFDEPTVAFEGDVSSADEVSAFATGSSLPLVVTFSQESAPKIFGGAVKQFLFLFADTDNSETDGLVEAMKPTAKEFSGKASIVLVKKSEDRIMEFFGLSADDLPSVKAVDMSEGMKKYGFDGQIVSDEITAFMTEFLDGKLTPELKSEEVPEKQEEDVFVLVGKNFEEVVGQEGTDVLVEFYAPWCGHCKKLAPIYDELAAKYKDNDKIIIAKMDSTANEVERVSVQGFPTLKFFPADSDEIVDYDGARDLDGFVKFLESNAVSLK